jgi:hypothetical protein
MTKYRLYYVAQRFFANQCNEVVRAPISSKLRYTNTHVWGHVRELSGFYAPRQADLLLYQMIHEDSCFCLLYTSLSTRLHTTSVRA